MKKRLHSIRRESTPESEESRQQMLKGLDRARMEGASSAIAAKIRRRLRVLGMSNADFARAIGTHAPTVTKWLSGSHNFELKTLVDIEDILDISIIDRNVIHDKTLSEYFITTSDTIATKCKYNVNVIVQVSYNSSKSISNTNSCEQDIKHYYETDY